jgi:hypothetical protein
MPFTTEPGIYTTFGGGNYAVAFGPLTTISTPPASCFSLVGISPPTTITSNMDFTLGGRVSDKS